MESLPGYYSVPGISGKEMVKPVVDLIGKPGGETENGVVAILDNDVAGVLTFINTKALPSARVLGAYEIYKSLSTDSAELFKRNLRLYNTDFGDLPENSIYISRFAIKNNYYGSGLAKQLVEKFISIQSSFSKNNNLISLHVNRNNARAVSFYKKQGFIGCKKKALFMSMVLKIEKNQSFLE